MGTSFNVESIITHPSRRSSCPESEEEYIFQQEQLTSICRLFGWSALPWNDPSEITGTSNDAKSWHLMADLALYAELYADKINTLSPHDLIELAINVESRYKDILNTPRPPIKGHLFTHLVYHHESTVYWLPHDFERPQLITTTMGNSRQYDFSIGSSYRLMQEMKTLCEICAGIVAVRDPLAAVGSRTWSDIQYLCDLIHEAAQESLTLNLPLQVFF